MPDWLMRAMILSCRCCAGHSHPQSCCFLGLWAGSASQWVTCSRNTLVKGKSQARVLARVCEYKLPFSWSNWCFQVLWEAMGHSSWWC